MKRVLFYTALVLSLFAAQACGKVNIPGENFYVKYEVQLSPHTSTAANIVEGRVATPEGIVPYQATRNYTETFGPVKRGFKASVTASSGYGSIRYAKIYVSINKEPFALKVEDSGSSVNISYVIQ